MIILGIDPGTARMGYGVLEKRGSTIVHVLHGCHEVPPSMPHADRLAAVHRVLHELIETHKPDLAGVERLFFQNNAKTAMSVSEARGVTMLALREREVPTVEFTPMQVKLATTGYGAADKRQVQDMIRRLLSLKEIPKPDDAADALAIAYCAAASHRVPVVH